MNTKIKVLIVEDSLVPRMAAKMSLEQMGCDVEVAETGEKALKMAVAAVYDLILMDIGLGSTDGFTVSQQIRKESTLNKETPIVALTAHGEDEYKIKAKEIGMCDYLNKPIEVSQIEKILNQLKSK